MTAVPHERNYALGTLAVNRAFLIAGHASDPLEHVTHAIHCDVAGDIVCRFDGDSEDQTLTLAAGATYRYELSHVRATGTTATVHGLYWKDN